MVKALLQRAAALSAGLEPAADVPTLFSRFAPQPAPDRRGEFESLPQRVDIAIIGAGVIGLSIGWALAARGLDVALFDARDAGGGTSSAATGMLAAAAEHEPGGERLLELARASQHLWPGFAGRVEDEAGRSIDYRAEGTLVVAIGRDETERLAARFDLQRRAGLGTTWLSSSALRGREPSLHPTVTGAIFCPEDHQVDPPALLAALHEAVLRRGGHVFTHQPVTQLDRKGGGIAGIVTARGRVAAGCVVLALGAAAAASPLVPPELPLRLRPLKGQAMALTMRQGPLPLEHVLWTADIHLAPKRSGRLVLGATVEECGFDTAITPGGLLSLLDGARRVLPGIEDMRVESLWSGLRPTSLDDAPLLGATALPGLVVATGHHRNGFLLAPVTAAAIADLVTTGRLAGPAAGFGPGRASLKVEATGLRR